MESMTGFGSSSAGGPGFQITAEARSVNSKVLSVSLNLPEMAGDLEVRLRELTRHLFGRGRIKISVTIALESEGRIPSIDTEMAIRYLELVRNLDERCGLSGELTAGELLRLPGVISDDGPGGVDPALIDEALESSARECLEALKASRMTEGDAIRIVFEAGFNSIRELAAPVPELHEEGIEERYGRLLERVAKLASDVQLDQDRMIQELAVMVDRSDISEEFQRLMCHLDHAEEVIASDDSQKGRLLGFVIQEIHRELNTMGSKVDNAGLSQRVMEMKNILASLKEQVANIE